jgi:hypothetical protein
MTPKEQAIKDLYDSDQATRDAGGDYRDNVAIAAHINALETFNGQPLSIANPEAQATLSEPITVADLMALVPSAEIAGFLDTQFQSFAKTFMDANPAYSESLQNDMIKVLGAMAGNPQKSDLIQAIDFLVKTDNREGLKSFLNVLEAVENISAETNTALASKLNETKLDPNYKSTIANPNRQFVTIEEVQNALNH